MSPDLLLLVFLGFGLGIIHALDADHVMALLALNSQTNRLRRIAYCCVYWAIGHGGVLLSCGVLLFGFGVIIPESLQWFAEFSVGILLVCLGIACLWRFRKAKLALHTHTHPHGEVQHLHWYMDGHDESDQQYKQTEKNSSLQAKHKPLMVGMLHGLAGSAPVLALIPAVNQGHIVLTIIYLLLFSVGMMLSMVVVGLSFAYFQQFMQARFQAIFQWSRYVLALSSVGLGAFWMFQASS